jgi:hypothetical protein
MTRQRLLRCKECIGEIPHACFNCPYCTQLHPHTMKHALCDSVCAAGELHYMFSYENWVHEAGFARLAISVVGLLILFNPFRRGERWAFIALLFLAAAYDVPVFLFGDVPNLGTWPVFRNWHLPQFKVQNLTWYFGLHSFSAPRYCLGSACRPRPFSAGKATEPS